ncbi:carbohydrate ABC transporter permease [Rugosimonospora africana]|uniref:Sugar ABC transporter permease n=1 Tax=Rugosimonospora africana TaxID=556532 RepID=A0A8J3VUD2_9ACTN|nr:sugar ABC transporter permease [Rugosimonospora africana]GIH18611.1 sugar ABC transporter permease [Rugosimonospora africana]
MSSVTIGRRRRLRELRRAAPFVLPFVLLFIVVYLIPTGYSIAQSLFKEQRSGLGLGGAQTVFAGFGNYLRAFQDSAFIGSLGRVAFIGVIQVPVMLGLALFFALLLDSRVTTPGRRFFRIAYFLPYGLPGVIAALVWSFLYAPTLSPVTRLLSSVGVHVSFVSDAALPFSIMNILTWAWTGYNTILIFAALQAIPEETMEAAALDGCSGWKAALLIKVPLVRPALLLTLVFSIIGTFQLYNEPVTMKAVAPNLESTYTPMMAALRALSANDFNYAAAQSVVLGALICVLSVLVFRFSAKRVDE